MKQLFRVANGDKAERCRNKPPNYVAHGYKNLALAELIGKRTHNQRCQSRGYGGSGNHGCNVICRAAYGIKQINIEIHIFYYPSKLACETEKQNTYPNSCAELS